MSTRTASRPASKKKAAAKRKPSPRARQRRRAAARRRIAMLVGVALASVAAVVAVSGTFDKAVTELRLPLRHDDIIRQQASEKGLPADLIAGIIYTESRFIPQTSSAGAQGLMQILPSTADYIAGLSGGTQFEQGDLANPQINIAYGTYYLKYLMKKYRGSEVLSLAAYNAGEGKVDEWLAGAAATGETFQAAKHIPFPETRHYVERVLSARDQYREQYHDELGL